VRLDGAVIEKPLSDLLPPPLRRALRAVADWPAGRRLVFEMWRQGFQPAAGGPVLSYGAALPRGNGGLLHGGLVKLTHLDRVFPEDARTCNVLYLVSSAIPQHAWQIARFMKKRGVRFVWNQNGVGFPGWAGEEAETFNAPMRALRRAADFVVYQSEFCRVSAERFLGPSSTPHAVIFNPVDLAAFHPGPPPDFQTWQLLASGTHMEAERVTIAIAVLAELRRRGRPAELTVAGQFRWPKADEQVRAAIERAGVAAWVRLRPAYSQAEAVTLFQVSHVLLHLKYHDPCPTVVIESLACGVPVIGSRSGGLPELVGADGGELLEVSQGWDTRQYPTAGSVADAVERIMARYAGCSSAARARAERLFDSRRWVQRHEEIFRQLLEQKS
jgi:glycosyltransferase involved in cell wall biosynthesis